MHIKNTKVASIIAIFLVISIGASTILIQTANAHTPPWLITPTAYCYATPDPCGVGQQAIVFGWLNYAIAGTGINNNIRFRDYQFIITAPDGTKQTYDFPIVQDTTSSQYLSYTPTQVGTYNITFLFKGQTYDFGGAYQGDYYAPANASFLWNVQETPVGKTPQNPLPTDYWTRPINQAGNSIPANIIGSNWLGGSAQSSGLMSYPLSYIQYNGAAPQSAHIMWTNPLEFGGLTGGIVQQPQLDPDTSGAYYQGMSYNLRFTNPIIINGILYYQLPRGYAGNGGGEVAVDLLTGETVWTNPDINPTFAMIDNFASPNGFGAGGATLWQVSGTNWTGYNAFDGKWIYNITNVPAGTQVYLNNGEIYKYVFSYSQTTKTGWLALWNLTRLMSSNSITWTGPGRVFNGSLPIAYSWNVSITGDLNGQFDVQPTIIGVIPGDVILGASSSLATTSQPRPNTNPWTVWALSDQPSSRGNLTWKKDYAAPPNNQTQMFCTQPIDATTRTFTMTIADTGQRVGYSLADGSQLWGPLGALPGFQYYSSREGVTYNGNLYVTGYGGIVYCYSMEDGSLRWTYGNGGAGNSTNMEDNGPWGYYPTHIATFADGILYTFTGEHSPESPLYNGAMTRALNATTGEELWTLLSWAACGLGNSMQRFAVADGYGVMYNTYDNQIYCVGRGPSRLSVTAPDTATTVGVPVTIRGTVIDISAGTRQNEQANRFPNGVPCVSEESMGQFMAAVYEDQAMPSNVTGVPVSVYVQDANGNYRQIGTTITDSSGMFTLSWAPDISGEYIVYATFDGSTSYYGSSSESSFYAIEPPATATPQPTQPASMADQYFLPAIAGIFVVLIVLIVLMLLVLRKRP